MCDMFFMFVYLIILYYILRRLYSTFFTIPPVPKLDENYWWTPDGPIDDVSIKPFKIYVNDEVLEDLQFRLKRARPFVPPLENIQHQYGINTNLLTAIIEFWKTKYEWREREKYLNQFPQYKTNIQGLDIHFLHVKPPIESDLKIIPLLLLHGWPGSIIEFYRAIPLLTSPQKGKDFVFEVIVPSLPGYGFSQAATKPGLGAAQMAVIFKILMKRLGYDQYYIQGGDWGSAIATHMAILYSKHVLGIHVNMTAINTPLSRLLMLVGKFFPQLVANKKIQSRIYPLSKLLSMLYLETGYMHIQATKPDTIGVALNDSPVGLAAYILEKFITWTNPDWKKCEDGGLKSKFSYTDLLDSVMLYWVTRSITTSMRLYAETMSRSQTRLKLDRIPVQVPSACARFGTDLFIQPDAVIKHKYPNLVQLNDLPTGGHFAAFEEPQLFAEDVWAAIEKFVAYHNLQKTM